VIASTMAAVTFAANPAMAQRVERAQKPSSALDTSDSALPLPSPRLLTHVPPVQQTGVVSGTDGHVLTVPLTAAFALEDLNKYQRQLGALFPRSADVYPGDSLDALQIARATEWLIRLEKNGDGVRGRQRIALAQIAFRAERDSLARALLDQRIVETATDVPERSLTLSAAVALFADPEQPGERLATNLPVAQAYADRLWLLPTKGFHTQADSVNVQRRKVYATSALMRGGKALRDPAVLWPLVDKFLAAIETLPHGDRFDLLRWSFPYQAVAASFPDSLRAAKLSALKIRLDSLVVPRAGDGSLGRAPQNRDRYLRAIHENFVALSLIGHPAPPVVAHAWLNTPDSLYAPTPRTHPFDDGIVRVIAMGSRETEILSTLDRIQRGFSRDGAGGVQSVFVTQTVGSAGPDVVSPPDEVAWLRGYFKNVRHSVMAIAVWAGDKTTNEYGWHEPQPSPMPARYELAFRYGNCVVVDGHGRVRAYASLDSRADERALVALLSALRSETGRHSTATQ